MKNLRLLPALLLFATAVSAFPADYSVKYDDSYAYVVRITDGKLKDIFLSQKSEKGLTRIPQTVRIEGSKFEILCDVQIEAPGGINGIALINLKGDVQLTKNATPKIGKYTGVLLKK